MMTMLPAKTMTASLDKTWGDDGMDLMRIYALEAYHISHSTKSNNLYHGLSLECAPCPTAGHQSSPQSIC
jgi:hypothetical protein